MEAGGHVTGGRHRDRGRRRGCGNGALQAPTSWCWPAGAVNSAALLLRSANDRHPNGLANGSDVVGRHYMRPQQPGPDGTCPRSRTRPRFQKKPWPCTTGISARGRLGLPHGRDPDARQVRRRADPRQRPALGRGPCPPGMPFEVLAHHAVDLGSAAKTSSGPENRVTLEDDGQIRLTLDEKNNVEGLKRLRHDCQSRLSDLGMHQNPLVTTASTCTRGCRSARPRTRPGPSGSVRPASSALDVNCRAHELDNLYVVDAGYFPSIGAVNPSLTAIANAMRVGDHSARPARLSTPDDRTARRGRTGEACAGCGSRGRINCWHSGGPLTATAPAAGPPMSASRCFVIRGG